MNQSNNGQCVIFSNLFHDVPIGADEEEFKVIAESNGMVIERIVSHGHTSAEWYDQSEDEFCTVIKGAAELLIEGNSEPTRMNPGAWAIIPAHVRHKVTYTDEKEPTIWIAVKWKPSPKTEEGKCEKPSS